MSYVLVRHAESQHNQAKREVKLKHPHSSTVKNTLEYRSIRIDPSLRDELITERGAFDA